MSERYRRGGDGRQWCLAGMRRRMNKGGPSCKRRYASIEAAWLIAFLEFLRHGRIVEPYLCNCMKLEMTVAKTIPRPNPWSWLPTKTLRRIVRRRRVTTCGGWHLSKQVRALPERQVRELGVIGLLRRGAAQPVHESCE